MGPSRPESDAGCWEVQEGGTLGAGVTKTGRSRTLMSPKKTVFGIKSFEKNKFASQSAPPKQRVLLMPPPA